ncbi:MAG: 5-(carboxyamino)imidazole ribonucleotide synthase [Rickettsiales bacterium]|nr:5-(carboxyamino)imidazole ribonucleotide synthase [Rickettsiales bacterium]
MPTIPAQHIKNIGIIGGGQLGQMSSVAAQKLGFNVVIYSDIADCPGAIVADELIVGDYLDEKKIAEFASKVDVVTCEFENIPYKTAKLLSELVKVSPNSEALKIAQNRIFEKNFVNDCGIKTADFRVINSKDDIITGLAEFKKAILKTATLGYDGKGQYVLNEGDHLDDIWSAVDSKKLVLEKFCPFEFEISILIARKENGNFKVFEPTKNIHKNGILDESHYPSGASLEVVNKAKECAVRLAQKLELVGLLCVEFFVLSDGEILVNEVAPRPHNSGHFTMDGANVSQYEQLIRAISHLDLLDIKYKHSGYMKNLIGEDVNNIDSYQNDENSIIHLYGKKEIKKGRKMGHVNILTK